MTQLANPICTITVLRLGAALDEPAPTRTLGQKGRPRKNGARRPTLEQVLVKRRKRWTRVVLHAWDGERRRSIEFVSETAVWFHSGMPAPPIRWVLIRDPKGKFRPQALLSTDRSVAPVQSVKWFVLRWQLDVTLHEVRTHWGVET